VLYLRPVDELVDEIRQAFAAGKRKVYFFNDAETIIPNDVIKIQRVIEQLDEIPESAFWLSTSAPYGQETYDDMRIRYKWNKRLTVLSCDNFERYISNVTKNNIEDVIGNYIIRLKRKKFVCFNKIHRLHRLRLLADMYNADLVKQAFYSFQGSDSGWMSMMNLPFDNIPIPGWQKITETIEAHKSEFPLTLNITGARSNPIDLIPDDLKYHQDSYFSVITETIFYRNPDIYQGLCLAGYENTLFISEKTYKAIGFKHPFIVLGWPGTLAYLRKTGYKTFHPYIDESYDNELDDEVRYQKIIAEIKRLCSFTDDQWLSWQSNIKRIVEHNFNVLLLKEKHHKVHNFEKLMG
jgi:hypothetical protein